MKRVAKKKLLPLAPYFAAMVPTNWLDPLLTGPKAVIGSPPYNCKDVEKVLLAVADRIRRSAPPQSSES